MTWTQTYDGKAFDLLNPSPDDIDPNTIAIVLSRICRFGGHCKEFYSVAQHSLLVESLVDEPRLKLPALLHDAHEVYNGFGDVCRPAKKLSNAIEHQLSQLEDRIDQAVAKRFGFPADLFKDDSIKLADNIALATEKRDVMLSAPADAKWEPLPDPIEQIIKPWDHHLSAISFRERLQELINDQPRSSPRP